MTYKSSYSESPTRHYDMVSVAIVTIELHNVTIYS